MFQWHPHFFGIFKCGKMTTTIPITMATESKSRMFFFINSWWVLWFWKFKSETSKSFLWLICFSHAKYMIRPGSWFLVIESKVIFSILAAILSICTLFRFRIWILCENYASIGIHCFELVGVFFCFSLSFRSIFWMSSFCHSFVITFKEG